MSLDEMKMINVCHFLKYICWEWGSGGGVHNSPVNIDNKFSRIGVLQILDDTTVRLRRLTTNAILTDTVYR